MKKATFSQKQKEFDNQEEIKKPKQKAWYPAHLRSSAQSDWAGMTDERCAY